MKIHINHHREAYNDLSRTSQHIKYAPPNETFRVRYILNSLQTNDPTICSAKTTIKADSVKKDDFEMAADFILITAPPPKISSDRTHQISDLGTKRGSVNTGPKTGVKL